MIKFRCEQCGQKIGVPEKLIGHHIECPRCHLHQLVQGAGAPSAALPSLLETAQIEPNLPPTAAPPEPERILRGQTLDLDEKPAEEPEIPPPAKAAQSSLLTLAGIDSDTDSSTDINKKDATSGDGGSKSSHLVVAYKSANMPGIAAGFIAVVAGCMIAVGAPWVATLAVAGTGAILAIIGLLIAMASRRWEQWSAVVGISFSLVAFCTAYFVGASRTPAVRTKTVTSPNAAAAARAVMHPVGFRAPPPVLQATVPDRARITVDSVGIGPPEFRPDGAQLDRTPRLLISLTITNLSNRPLNYLSWGPGGRIATLSSLNGVQLTPITFPKGALLNHPQQAIVSPHGTERDVLVYAPIYPLPPLLALDLPCGNIGSLGALHLLIPNSVSAIKK